MFRLIALILMVTAAFPVSLAAETTAPPPAGRLSGLAMVWQQYNRCSAAAFAMQMSYFNWKGSYTEMIAALNPHAEDVNVRLEEMVTFAEAQGLKALIRTGGTLDTLRHLITAGFPVLVENTYYEGDPHPRNWMSHNRIIVGYDDAAASVYTYDPLLGFGGDNSGRPMPYTEFDETWRHFSRVYLVVYRPSDEPLLRAALGSAWDEAASRDSALEQAQTESDGAFKDDAFALFNTGAALTDLGRYDEAAPLFDRALEIGLPWRFLWYRFEPFEAYIQVGRYDDVLKLAKDVLTDTPGVEEMYYYAGRAYEAQGNTDRAKANYQVALQRNKYFSQAAEALAALTN